MAIVDTVVAQGSVISDPASQLQKLAVSDSSDVDLPDVAESGEITQSAEAAVPVNFGTLPPELVSQGTIFRLKGAASGDVFPPAPPGEAVARARVGSGVLTKKGKQAKSCDAAAAADLAAVRIQLEKAEADKKLLELQVQLAEA